MNETIILKPFKPETLLPEDKQILIKLNDGTYFSVIKQDKSLWLTKSVRLRPQRDITHYAILEQ